jgi:hypothetical protein
MTIESSRFPLQRFPDFGKELRRPFEVHEVCYDCAEFYGPGHGERGCDAWPANKPMKTPDKKHLLCLDFNRLPDVMPGEPTGQIFPPSRMNGRRTPRERTTEPATAQPIATAHRPAVASTRQIDPQRRCPCGQPVPKRRRYCDRCTQVRKQQAKEKYELEHTGRSHRPSRGPEVAQGRPVVARLRRGDS